LRIFINPATKKFIFILSLGILIFLTAYHVFASSTGGGGLPSDSWLQKLMQSITGPWAYAISVGGLVSTGAGLIFGNAEIGAFIKSILWLALVLSFIVAAANTISGLTGQGAEITAFSHALLTSVGRV
jgi:type IV secretory pathway VirB2 component (pilin)